MKQPKKLSSQSTLLGELSANDLLDLISAEHNEIIGVTPLQ